MPTEVEHTKSNPPDGGFGWVIVIAAILNAMLYAGHMIMFSILLPEYVEYFQINKATASVVSAVGMSTSGLLGVFHGKLVEYFGCRKVAFISALIFRLSFAACSLAPNIYVLIVTHGLIPGVATGSFPITNMVMVASYFNKKRGLAQGLAVTGTGLGLAVYGRFGPFLLTHFGWRGCMLICGGIHLNAMVIALLYRPLNTRKERTIWKCSLKAMFDFSLFKNTKYVLYVAYICCLTLGHVTTLIFIPALAQSLGSSKANSATLLSLYGIISIVCRPLYGKLVDYLRNYRTLITAVAGTVVGVATAVSYISVSYLQLVIYICIFAVASACYIAVHPTVLGDLLGADRLAVGGGLCFTVTGAVQMAVTPISGWLVDITGSFSTPFLVFGCVQIVGSFMCFILYFLQRKHLHLQNHDAEITTELNEINTKDSKKTLTSSA